MMSHRFFLLALLGPLCTTALNLAPSFTADMNQHTLNENTPVGTVVYQLVGADPEGSRVTFGIEGTESFAVDPVTGEVTVTRAIDREDRTSDQIQDNEIRLTVTIADEVSEGEGRPNVVRVPISVIVLDENDNKPVFRGTPYKAQLNEDTPVGTTVFRAIEATDRDLVGEVLEMRCDRGRAGYDSDACDTFEIKPRRQETDHDMFRGSVVLKKPLDYRQKQIYQLPLAVFDGVHTVYSELTFTVSDVQNSPPVFMGSLTGIVNEDDAVGTMVLTVKAKDGDTGNSRRIVYSLLTNPNDYFVIDPDNGEISVDRTLDRESLSASSGVLTLRVRASELVNGVPSEKDSSTADVSVTIRDVNDEAPKFDRSEYDVTIPENVPYGTPLANLNMEVKDTDTGPNALFKIELIDRTGKFSADPQLANGHTAVSLKVNSQKLDYENPNERKFLLLVVATETNTEKKLSSTATVTVQVQDLNDNSPVFEQDSYTALVSESSTEGHEVVFITAKDRDSGDYGTQGIRYQLYGNGAELFSVDPISGRITVSACGGGINSIGETEYEDVSLFDVQQDSCLDYETTKAYFLSYSATDNNGEGRKSVVNLRISVADANDNPPKFARERFVASIDEGQVHFQPRLILKASDPDDSSQLTYKILDGNLNNLFLVNPRTGEVSVAKATGLRLDNIPTDKVKLIVQVTDGTFDDATTVDLSVRDVNDRHPVFERPVYQSSVPENAPPGTAIENVLATDADFGPNAEIVYRIQKGAYDDFQIDPLNGVITTSSALDFDRRPSYNIEVVAVDKGVPSLSGTAMLNVNVMNKNDKMPAFLPSTQRAQVTEDTEIGTFLLRLNASDLDASAELVYSFVQPVTAVDRDGKPVQDSTAFYNFFYLNSSTGDVFINERLDRNVASIVSLTLQVSDMSADPPQHGLGSLVVQIVDINDFPPHFQEPWTVDSPYITLNVAEEQPNGTVVYKFLASDADSNIDFFQIRPRNEFFDVDRESGNLLIKSRIDYESMDEESGKRLTFDVVVFDAGVPQKSASALVIANIINLNDEAPVFEKEAYFAQVWENSAPSTPIVSVRAVDIDEGEFGLVSYRLTGSSANAFSISPNEGVITVGDPSILDRETTEYIVLQVVATDSAPSGSARSTVVPVNITILDLNDNQPKFIQTDLRATIIDNIPYFPEPSPITQLSAIDYDTDLNAKLFFAILSGNEDSQFRIDHDSGIIYPNNTFAGQTGAVYTLTVGVTDEAGRAVWPSPDIATVVIDVENVNTHKPEWFPEPPPDQTIELEEEMTPTSPDGFVILKINARDRDVGGDNRRISYFLKVNNENAASTDGKFRIDPQTGELSAIGTFDREEKDRYELILVARDHGTPVAFETLRFVTILIKDINDNGPEFPAGVTGDNMVRFTVPEEEETGYFVGRVLATDGDSGRAGRVFYFITSGNDGRHFSVDKTYGNIYTKKKLDRETDAKFELVIKSTNNPDYICDGGMCDIENGEFDPEDKSMVKVQIFVEDKNDNLPRFRQQEFFVGIPFNAKVGDLILDAEAYDPDVEETVDSAEEEEASALSYSIRSSDLFRAGSLTSAGSLVPSPFRMEANGRLTLGSLIAEFNQDRFVIDIEAKERDSNHRAKARVNLWIYEPEQLIKLVVARSPKEVNDHKVDIVKDLHNATGSIIVIDDIRFHVSETTGRLNKEMTDMLVHAVDPDHNLILMPEEVLAAVDANYDSLSGHYEEAGIHSILPATSSEAKSAGFDPNLLALIALLILLFLGAVMFTILCCCMKSWVAKASSKQHKLKESQYASNMANQSVYGQSIYSPASEVAPTPAAQGDGGATDNPLWIDQKYKAYEEQELTMMVFSDQENSVISSSQSGQGQQQVLSHPDTASNAYATINKLPVPPASRRSGLFGAENMVDPQLAPYLHPERDYATLEKTPRSPPGPLVPGIHSTPNSGYHQQQQNYGGMMLFGDDDGTDNGDSPRSNQGHHHQGGRGGFRINQHGEPELVADLI